MVITMKKRTVTITDDFISTSQPLLERRETTSL